MRNLILISLVVSACAQDTLTQICGNVGTGCYAVPGISPGVPKDESAFALEQYYKAAGKGVCTLGVPTCDARNNIIKCEGEGPLPSREVCDTLDNDCDGKVDDDWNDEPLIANGADDTCGTFGECAKYNAVCIYGHFICPYSPQL